MNWSYAVALLLAATGVGIAIYVICKYALPPTIDFHMLKRSGEPKGPENTLEYLFVIPVYQAVVATAGAWMWRDARAGRIRTKLPSRFPPARSAAEAANGYLAAAVILMFFQIHLLLASMYRAFFVVLYSL